MTQYLETTYDLIRQAIIDKRQIHAFYNGYWREMCPHVLGTKNGREQCLLIQFDGQSKSGLSEDPAHNWRCCFLSEISGVQVHDGLWHTAPNHSRPQTCVDEIDVEVEH